MPWYRTGTVAIAAGQNTVTGTGTSFSANARVGDAFLGPDGNWYEVTNIASATVLSILPAYKGSTVSGGAYAVVPVQGYDKSLRDAINAIVQQWGATLAGLGAVSTENVLPVSKGGTGGTTQADARTGLGLKKAAVADIVGTVSQSGGTPTGAIYERGSNANGEYTAYADGTLECFARVECTYSLANLLVGPWTYPKAFSSATYVPVVEVTVMQPAAADITPVTSAELSAQVAVVGYASASPRVWKSPGTSNNFTSASKVTVGVTAKGRWF
ncbi:phage tail protein [Pseudomonas sp. SWI44]|uniref:phage tail protein n=1 Tax=Pseudomonas sp. SWI44 TaxID=2083053 RepID=UPI000CE5E3AB|nr:phage tail protein [Pseudomonas sp. SWI44]AVD85948.1 phage tail protein [Pseudomonas sp. SWI44]